MELKFTVDTDDLYEDRNFEHLFKETLMKEIITKASERLKTPKFSEFSNLAAEKVETEIKLKLEHFLGDDIALTDKWGKPVFVGSIEDLIKQRFDDILLRSVDNSGKNITGCHIAGQQTWIEWKIEFILKEKMDIAISNAIKKADLKISSQVKSTVDEITTTVIQDKIKIALTKLVK
jgi:hypothetical protein